MKKNIAIIEDTDSYFELIKEGVEDSKIDLSIIPIDMNLLYERLYKKDEILILATIPDKIDYFIIDVSLGKGKDELGLDLLLILINNYKYNFKYLVTSVWHKELFESKLKIPDIFFINKNNFMGFELSIEIRNKINKLWKE